METKTLYSLNDEEYLAIESEEIFDVLFSNDELAVGAKYYECQFKPLTMLDCIDANKILDNASESAYDLIIEEIERDNQFDDVSEEAKKELNEFLEMWATKHLKLERFYIPYGKSKEMFVIEEDIDNYVNE